MVLFSTLQPPSHCSPQQPVLIGLAPWNPRVATWHHVFELFGHKRRSAQEGNAATPQLLEKLDSGGIHERNVRQIERQTDPVAESVHIAGFSKLLDPTAHQPTFYPKSCRLA